MVNKGASDLHITVGSPPRLRLDGALVPLKAPPLTAQDTRQLCYSVLTDTQKQKLEETRELDLSFGVKDLSRFRANVFFQRGAVAAVFRLIPFEVESFEALGLPSVVETLGDKPHGLILITGPTGSGKSTTLAAIVDKINATYHKHILTIEDPIEYLHRHKKSLINQREIGADTDDFQQALRHVLRQDPDVVLVGEMRDKDTFEAALKISETGHLCLATLHTNSCVQSINRILDVFPPHQQNQVRAQLSFVFEAVVSQQLIPRADGAGRVLATEVMLATPAVRNLIREDKIHQIYSQMQVGQTKYGMQTMNQSLFALFSRGLITLEDALARSGDPEEFRNMMVSGGQAIPSPRY
jgi:twitching motility protein PilT